jgi:hypothetical protein
MAFSGGQSGWFCVPAGQVVCDVVAQEASSNKVAGSRIILSSNVTGFIDISLFQYNFGSHGVMV